MYLREVMMNILSKIWETWGTAEWAVLALGAVAVVYAVWLARMCTRVGRRVPGTAGNTGEGVSVILTAQNDAELLRENLPAFLEQDYADYEVIVVDESSEDETADVLEALQQRYPRLRCTRVPAGAKFRFTKKLAINIGVLAARHDLLLFSEIYCRPTTRQWMAGMAACMEPGVSVVQGFANELPGPEAATRFRWFRLRRFLRWVARDGREGTMLGDGCNLAYRKSLYLENRGFARDSQSMVGYENDMIRDLGRRGKQRVCRNPETFVEVRPGDARGERKAVALHYAFKWLLPWRERWRMEVPAWTRLAVYGCGAGLLAGGVLPWWVGGILLAVWVAEWGAALYCAGALGQRKRFRLALWAVTAGCGYRWWMNGRHAPRWRRRR